MSDRPDDGMGQSFLEELIWHWRFLRWRWSSIPWRAPTPDEDNWIAMCPRISRFGDFTLAIADLEGKRWAIRERFWSGWPDPPTYVVFAFKDEEIWMARDFEFWPKAWKLDNYGDGSRTRNSSH